MTGGFEESNEVCANAYASVQSLANALVQYPQVPTIKEGGGQRKTETQMYIKLYRNETLCVFNV